MTSNLVHASIHKNPVLVFDAINAYSLPRNFRSSSNILPQELDHRGFKELRSSGSGQFSELELKKMLTEISAPDLVIVDLRQESHGFLNGNAISWYKIYNDNNKGKTHKKIEQDQLALLTELSYQSKIKIHSMRKLLAPKSIQLEELSLKPKNVISEPVLLKNYQKKIMHFKRFYITDHYAPTVSNINSFINFIKKLPKDSWLHFHCRAGKGRTTVFMVIYDILHNAKHVSLEQIFKRQAIGGKDLRVLPAKDSYKYAQALLRLKLIEKFYAYCKSNHDNFKTKFIG